MNASTRALIALVVLIAVALCLSACDGFFVSPNAVGSITVSPTSAILSATGTTAEMQQQLAVSSTLVNGSAGTDVTSSATYSSSPSGVVTVSAGLVSAVAAGSATVTVSDSGATALVSVVVTSAPITTITITPANPTIAATGSVQLIAKAQDGTDITNLVQWSSNNTSVNVNTTGSTTPGLVTAASTLGVATNATITASITFNGQTISGTTTVNVS